MNKSNIPQQNIQVKSHSESCASPAKCGKCNDYIKATKVNWLAIAHKIYERGNGHE